jgi:hypothetical protein
MGHKEREKSGWEGKRGTGIEGGGGGLRGKKGRANQLKLL